MTIESRKDEFFINRPADGLRREKVYEEAFKLLNLKSACTWSQGEDRLCSQLAEKGNSRTLQDIVVLGAHYEPWLSHSKLKIV
jgi:hypothetical protein